MPLSSVQVHFRLAVAFLMSISVALSISVKEKEAISGSTYLGGERNAALRWEKRTKYSRKIPFKRYYVRTFDLANKCTYVRSGAGMHACVRACIIFAR